MQKLTKEKIEEEVRNIIVSYILKEGLDFDNYTEILTADFTSNIGMSSLDIVELLMETEHYFNIKFSDRDMLRMKNGEMIVNKIVEYLPDSTR